MAALDDIFERAAQIAAFDAAAARPAPAHPMPAADSISKGVLGSVSLDSVSPTLAATLRAGDRLALRIAEIEQAHAERLRADDRRDALRKRYDTLLQLPAPPKCAATMHAWGARAPDPVVVPSFETFADRVETLEKAHKAEQIASDTIEKAYRPAEFTAPLRPGRPASPTFTSPPARSHRLIPAGVFGFDSVGAAARLRPAIKATLERQAANLVREVATAAVDGFDPEKVAAGLSLDYLKELAPPVAAELAEVARKSAKSAIQSIEHIDSRNAVAESDKAVGAWAKDRAAELVGRQRTRSGRLAHDPDAFAEIIGSTRRMILRALIAAKSAGSVGNRVAVAVHNCEAFTEKRADLIAKTELTTAHNVGLVEGFRAASKAYGGRVKKEWFHDDSEIACDECRENAAAGPIELDAEFPSGDLQPIAHPHCGCRLAFHVYS